MKIYKDFDWLNDLRTWEDSFLDEELLETDQPSHLTQEQALNLVDSSEEIW